jgi:DNA-binding NtrC family response regulator
MPMRSPTVQATILRSDDQADVRTTRAEALRRQGSRVLTAADVSEADAIGQRLGLEPLDLVILDLEVSHLPQARAGYTLVQRWGACAPHLPFILLSNGRMPDRLAPPVVWWLATPLTSDTLLMAVRDSLGA